MNNTPITNISLGLHKKSYTIDGDENSVIYLDPSDMNILNRIQEFSAEVDVVLSSLKELSEEDEVVPKLAETDAQMRELINKLFDYDVCSVCVPSGTLFDAIGGQFKFEIIVDGLSKVYADNISAEMKKVTDRMSQHTKKYVKKK